MGHADVKADRLLKIEALLLAHPEGLTAAELGRKLGVHRGTVGRYLGSLPKHIYIDDLDENRWKIDRDGYLVNVRFTLHESLSLHLAARLMATSTDKQNPHAAAALRKLGIALEKLAPLISEHLKDSADVMDDAARYHDPVYLDVLETLTRAWSMGRKVSLKHQLPDQSITEYTFSPYFVEPYAVGQSTHTIGWREPPGALRTFKVERIRAIKLSGDPYTIPLDFDARSLLADAWGIWYTEKTPVTVRLRFHPNVAARVQETHWHRSAVTNLQSDGYLLWEAQIAEPREMLPWIRGWGGDVEVLAPEEMRAQVEHEVERMTRVYRVASVTSIPHYFWLWAKVEKRCKPPKIHRLIYHLLDVSQVALVLWQQGLNDAIRHQITAYLGMNEEQAGKLISFWAALHDLGKASPIFQAHPFHSPSLQQALTQDLRDANFKFHNSKVMSRHEVISTWALNQQGKDGLLASETGLAPQLAARLATVLGGHHGTWPISDDLKPEQLFPAHYGTDEWDVVRAELVRALKNTLQPPTPITFKLDTNSENALWVLLSGIVSVADWIGSNEEYFGYKDKIVDLNDYIELAACRANLALCKLEWLNHPTSTRALNFEQMFEKTPRPIQTEVIQATADLPTPALIILEAPTGIGKTEMALYIAQRWMEDDEQQGLYVAMPTTATSNQMFDRVMKFVGAQYGAQVQPLLVHSQAELREQDITMLTKQEETENTDRVAVLNWFLPRKRSLLTHFGVGTVDQALMSVLLTKHFFVRLLGLSRKVVIFDEVHAYDVYMSTLFKRLLEWLRALGASVIILSATLPDKTRHELASAYLGVDAKKLTLEQKDYPRLTCVTPQQLPQVLSLTPPTNNLLALKWTPRTPEEIKDYILKELAHGGCAAVVCNTIGRAQAIYQIIRDSEPNCEVILFHARFPYLWRKEIETDVLHKFGPRRNPAYENPERPHKAIVIATQVIEQSLDLDFDMMITDLAPVDLLLQRAGRLHRHEHREHRLPYQLAIAAPELHDGIPAFDHTDPYARDEVYILRRTYFVLSKHAQPMLALPGETAHLIEQVYGDVPLDELSAVEQTVLDHDKQKMQDAHDCAKKKARSHLIYPPSDSDLLRQKNQELEEDDPGVHQAFQALTRDGGPGLSVICLHRTKCGLALDPRREESVIDLHKPLTRRQIALLLHGAVNIRHYDLIEHFLTYETDELKPVLTAWKKVPALRYHRLAIFEDGIYDQSPTHQLHLNREFGLQIISRKEQL
jgi:CRISPR-associated endonuclease/helicase Cas3